MMGSFENEEDNLINAQKTQQSEESLRPKIREYQGEADKLAHLYMKLTEDLPPEKWWALLIKTCNQARGMVYRHKNVTKEMKDYIERVLDPCLKGLGFDTIRYNDTIGDSGQSVTEVIRTRGDKDSSLVAHSLVPAVSNEFQTQIMREQCIELDQHATVLAHFCTELKILEPKMKYYDPDLGGED